MVRTWVGQREQQSIHAAGVRFCSVHDAANNAHAQIRARDSKFFELGNYIKDEQAVRNSYGLQTNSTKISIQSLSVDNRNFSNLTIQSSAPLARIRELSSSSADGLNASRRMESW